MDHYAIDDHNPEDSFISLNCQIFTIISFVRGSFQQNTILYLCPPCIQAKYLLESHNILDNIMRILYETLLIYSKPLQHPKIENKIVLHFEKEEQEIHKKFDPFERRMRSLYDLKFLLTSLVTAYTGHKETDEIANPTQSGEHWTSDGVENFMKYFRTFSDFLSVIQVMIPYFIAVFPIYNENLNQFAMPSYEP